jgi:dihydroxyacid dehydratase/phosphogluconate dehydratase
MTVTGKTLAENLASCPELSEGQKVIMPVSAPIKKTVGLCVALHDAHWSALYV